MSFWIAFGRIRSSTKRRTGSWSSRCSSESSRSIAAYPTGAVGFAALAAAAGLALYTPQQKAALVVASGLPAPRGVAAVIVRPWDRTLPRPRGALVLADQEGGVARAFTELPPFLAASGYASVRQALEAGRATARARDGRGVDVAPERGPVLSDGPS